MTPVHFTFRSALFLGPMALVFHRTQFLSALLCLGGMKLVQFIAIALWGLPIQSSCWCADLMLMTAFSACDASTGLPLLLATPRTQGTDCLPNLNLLQC
uniref:NADH-ubiquinone oxidoreductase chain 4L n=1 Tax=Danio albolineatus TaxID=27699 RepID=A0A140EA00_9TELE|nr:NADH dehydrogenase subunit 4L [Danio albolineatus]AMK97363.1 NADH dehydrogenase subunit 4L [Danio albolineatus]